MSSRGWTETGQAISSAVARRILAETRHDAGSKGIVRSLAIGSWWTTGRWSRAGHQIDNRCPLCGSCHEDDTVWHRLWRCPATADLRQSEEMAKVTMRARQAGPRSVLYSTGLVANPAASAPGPADAALGDWLHGEEPWDRSRGDLYWDGSATTYELDGCNRAGWAVIQMAPGAAAPHRVVRGAVPSCYPQTAQAAETCALWAATTLQPRRDGEHGAHGNEENAHTEKRKIPNMSLFTRENVIFQRWPRCSRPS